MSDHHIHSADCAHGLDLAPDDSKLIAFYFTMSLASGKELDSNRGGEPMVFQSGIGEMLPAVEEQLVSMEPGQAATIILPPERAYGPVLEQEMRRFPLNQIPDEARQVGRKIMARSPSGEERMLDIVAIEGDEVVIDFNHDLAGQTLKFDLEVVSSEACR